MARPLVSIITPTLDQRATIEASLASVRAQTYPNIEHIVVDGGSTDGTLDVLESAPRLAWRSEPDSGMYDAVNKGLRLATGEILGYLNSDDRLTPWAIETVVQAFEDRRDVGVLFGDALEQSGTKLEPKLQIPFRRDRLIRFGSFVQPAVFWRREVVDRSGAFDATLQFVGDLEYWLRVSRSERVEHLDEILAVYLVHPEAKTSRSRRAMRAEERTVRRKFGMTGASVAPANLLARLSHGLASRSAVLRFIRANGSARDPRWARFRAGARPAVHGGRLLLALVPLAGRRRTSGWLELQDSI